MKKIKQLLLTTLMVFMYYPAMASDDYSVHYEFSVLFLAKTCEIDVPNEIILGNSSGVTTVNEIKNDTVSKNFPIGLRNCTSTDQTTAVVYLASGNTLTGSNNFFNDDPNGVIGVQLLDGTRVISVNQTPLAKPDASSIIWDNIKTSSETKVVNAKLRCAKTDCEPDEGDFSATLTIGYYAD
ncbi:MULTISPECIES: fimbrial protein [Providencia]|uniref:fimbrial protein n=1 Tax=Providencia TaxID=586 RepID=UPI001BD32458|nr:fimbrial protein [Providencia rettgeri]ELR5072844.1 type 1 fimbrial protein [Providencia stuartii]ELR5070626.1 type 1 fimbrial protein [Providencia rettgeri]ELR5224195.1 type 1 fimbrial protein [Providencia rettgeri]MDX7324325.1 fimbrial protein [Providencia rettgeri]UPS62010.1 type 1 fimbrial protein [Providencia rettgeri]